MSDLDKGILVRDPTGKFKILRGGKLYDLPTPPSPKPTAPPPQKLVDQFLEKSGIKVSAGLEGRLEEIFNAYNRDARDRFETKSTLVRAVNLGGMGFSAEQADLLMKFVKSGAVEKTIPSEAKTVVPAPRRIGPRKPLPPVGVIHEMVPETVSPAPKITEMSAGVAEFVFSPADEAEILAARQKLPKTMVGMKPVEIAKVIEEILEECGLTSLPQNSLKELKSILLANFKDIRDGFETRETLSGLIGPKGINLTNDQLEKIFSVTRREIQKLELKTKDAELQRIKTAMDEQKIKSEEIKGKTVDDVKEKMDERWREITRKEESTPLSLPQELVAPPIGVQLKAAGELPKISVVSGVPSAPKTAIRTGEIILPSKITPALAETEFSKTPASAESEEEKPKPLQIFKPVSPPQIRRPVPPQDNRPRLDDVKYVPKLVGPVEELREMTLIDWRRLGATPAAAAEKIKEKIGILEREAFSKKIAGIKAWQESEINKLYLEISRESLQRGEPSDKIITERTAAGKPTLTSEEYRAVMDLNRALRY